MTRKSLAVVAVAAATALSLAACGSSSSSGSSGGSGSSGSSGDYTIGFTDGLTGATAGYTQPELLWTKAVFNTVNAAGGVNGHKINLVALDQGAPGSGQATANVIQLASQKKASAILGMLISNDCASVVATVERYQTPILCQRAPISNLDPVNKYVFVDTSIETMEAKPGLELLKKITGKSSPRIAILGNDNIGTNAWAKTVQKLAKDQGITITTYQNMPETATTANTEVAAIVASKPDAVYAEIFGQFFQPLMQGLSNAGLNIPVLGTSGDVPYGAAASINSPNLYNTSLVAPLVPDDPKQTDLLAQFKALGATTAEKINDGSGSLDAVGPYAIVEALKQCGYPCPGNKMADALETVSLNVDGLISSGAVGYSKDQHVGAKTYSYFKWDPASKKEVLYGTEPAGSIKDGS